MTRPELATDIMRNSDLRLLSGYAAKKQIDHSPLKIQDTQL